MRPQSRVENGQMYPQAQRIGHSYFPLAFRGLGSTSTILNETAGQSICGGFQGFDAHAEQERSEFSGTGDDSSIQKPFHGCQEATVYVYDSHFFVTVQILVDMPAVLSLGILCEDHGYSYQ